MHSTVLSSRQKRQNGLPKLAQVTMSYDSLFNASGSYIYYQQFAATIHMLQLFVVTLTIYSMSRGTMLLTLKPLKPVVCWETGTVALFFTTLLMVGTGCLR